MSGEEVINSTNRPNTSQSSGSGTSNTNYANAFNIGYQNHFYQQQQQQSLPPPQQSFQPPMLLQYQPQIQPLMYPQMPPLVPPPMLPPLQSQYQSPVVPVGNYGPPPVGLFDSSNNTVYPPPQPPNIQMPYPPQSPPNSISQYHGPINTGGYYQDYGQQNLPINQTQFPNPTGLVTNVPLPTGSNNPNDSINQPEDESSDIEELSKDEFNLQKEQKPKEVYYTMDELKSKLNDPYSLVQLKFEYYTQLSDHFIKKAHSHVAKTRDCETMRTYHKLIKLAINCLEILEAKYPLKDYQRFIVYYKLTLIYLQETDSQIVGSTNLQKATKIARDASNTLDYFKCQLLHFQYLDKTGLSFLINDLNTELKNNKDTFTTQMIECIELFKIKYYLAYNPDAALALLTRIIQQENNSAKASVKLYCLILSANLQLYRGSPHIALELIDKAEISIKELKIDCLILPALLVRLVAFIQLNKDCKSLIRQISENFNQYGKLYHDDGQIKLPIVLDEWNHTFHLKFDWLTTEEISIIVHFLTGVSFLKDSRNKSQMCFDKALKNLRKLQKYDKYHDISIDDFNRRLQRLKYLKILFNIYKTINNFILNDYNLDPLNEFMQETNQNEFETEYSIMIQSVYPLIYYCFAMFYHHNADLQAAKYYYLKVIQLLGNNNSINLATANDNNIDEIFEINWNSFIQLLFGVPSRSVAPKGKFNELYVFATLNLTILLDYEHGILKDKTPSYAIQLKHKCLDDLQQAFKDSEPTITNAFNQNFTLKSDILHITYNLVLKVLFEKQVDLEFDTKLRQMLETLGDKSSFAFFYILIMYLLDFKIKEEGQNSTMEKQKNLLQQYQEKLKFDNDTELICKLLILKSFMKQFKLIGDHDKAYLSQMQYEQCEKMLMKKFEFLKGNVVDKDENSQN